MSAVNLCAQCGSDSQVIETRPSREHLRRRRQCLQCGTRWATREVRIASRGADEVNVTLTIPSSETLTARQLIWLLLGAFGTQPKLTAWDTCVLQQLDALEGAATPKQLLAAVQAALRVTCTLPSLVASLTKHHQSGYALRDHRNVYHLTPAGKAFLAGSTALTPSVELIQDQEPSP